MTITLLVGTVDHNVINSHYLPNEVRIDVLSLSFRLHSTSTGSCSIGTLTNFTGSGVKTRVISRLKRFIGFFNFLEFYRNKKKFQRHRSTNSRYGNGVDIAKNVRKSLKTASARNIFRTKRFKNYVQKQGKVVFFVFHGLCIIYPRVYVNPASLRLLARFNTKHLRIL